MEEKTMSSVIVVIGAGQIGQAIARRVGVGEARRAGRSIKVMIGF
jgi:predicted dinucleotide-binding enzyme